MNRTIVQSRFDLETSSPIANISPFACFNAMPAKIPGTIVMNDFLSFSKGTLGVAHSIKRVTREHVPNKKEAKLIRKNKALKC
ncbi:hypothetical protein [Lacrimispora sphenoides]|uniref:hypothetical protein n=1 Tax=Lacrimispora sphenoides TaxID=29370 RepID=UPI001FA8C498|nr:hypothetical protein [Lacrimispora sphenoides]